jgi:short-subunit dehydrogenase
MSAVHPLPYFSAYGATKISIDYLTKALKAEYPNIDWISLKPNFVDTNINNHMKTIQTVDPEGVVEGTIADLGKYTETYGHWKHQIINTFLRNVPIWIVLKVFKNIMIPQIKGHHDKHRHELEKKNI